MEVCIHYDLRDPRPRLSPVSTALPAAVSGALAALVEGRSGKDLRARARRISETFRARRPSAETIRDEADALAYALSRLPATYAASVAVLGRMREEAPEIAPARILDLGCGLGAASFAAALLFPQLAEITLLDHSAPFLALARRLAAASGIEALAAAQIIQADMERLPDSMGRFDLVVASYALTELPDAGLTSVLDAVWPRVEGALVVIEPGTPRDHERLMTLRARLVAAGGHIALPCPHDRPCPLQAPDWCHFAARLPRSRAHKALKEAEAPFEDEKFSYLVATREAPRRGFARLLRPPRTLKYGVELKLCAPDGIGETTVLKRDKPRYEPIRKSSWGDSVGVPDADPLLGGNDA